MKAKTLYQPFASLIAEGFKTIETRSQPPPLSLIGQRIAIHAGKRPIHIEEWSYEMRYDLSYKFEDSSRQASWPYGVVVATAVLQCAHIAIRPPSGRCFLGASWLMDSCAIRDGGSGPFYHEEVEPDPFGDFSEGRWLWFLRDVEKVVPPAPAKGSQGWWEWT